MRTKRFGARWTRPVAVTAAVVGALVGTAACGNSAPSEGALQGKTAPDIVHLSITAFHHQRSVHYATRTTGGSSSNTTQVGAVSTTKGGVTVAEGKTTLLELLLEHNVIYVRGGANVLETVLGVPTAAATAHAGKWLSVSKGEAGFLQLEAYMSPTTAIKALVPQEPDLKVAGVTQFSGQPAVAVKGSPSVGVSPGTYATVTLFVSTSAPYLPLGATLQVQSVKGNKTTERLAAVYGRWNQRLDPQVPKNAVPVATLTG
jgi:hypothetical protein